MAYDEGEDDAGKRGRLKLVLTVGGLVRVNVNAKVGG